MAEVAVSVSETTASNESKRGKGEVIGMGVSRQEAVGKRQASQQFTRCSLAIHAGIALIGTIATGHRCLSKRRKRVRFTTVTAADSTIPWEV